ncbi:MAG: hypothetical protein HY660_02240 [Armatimonadetes bacterium]|nr:hypothetical protein [Armatimonadota bacterium]
MRCPHCGSEYLVSNVTIRWMQVRGMFLHERGHYCVACGKGIEGAAAPSEMLLAVRVERVSAALRSLQESGDVVVVQHRDGTKEVLF